MKVEYIDETVINYVKNRLLGIKKEELSLPDNYDIICFSNQDGKSYYFDLGIELGDGNIDGFEGRISTYEFSLIMYTKSTDNMLRVDISTLDKNVTEEEYFMLSTIHDYSNISYNVMSKIVDIREILKSQENLSMNNLK